MSATVVVDGRSYDIPDSFTYREMSVIKKLSGIRAGEIAAALEAGDTDLIVAITVIAMRRAGNNVSDDFLFDLPADGIQIVGEPEADANPPAKAARAAADKPDK